MTARDLLHRALARGVDISAEDGELILRGDESAVAALVPDAKALKGKLLQALSQGRELPEDLLQMIEYVAAFYGFTDEELCTAKEIAADDIENATRCFRAIRDEIKSRKRMVSQ